MRLLQRRLESECGKAGRREFIQVLRLLENYSFDELGRAVERALQVNSTAFHVIRVLLQENCEQPAKLFVLDGRPHLQEHSIPAPHIYKYNQLLTRNDSNEETRNEEYRIIEASPESTKDAEHAQ